MTITPPGREDGAPAWSPVAPRIAFYRLDRRPGGQSGIFVANADGSRARLLAADGGLPIWSPDGRKVAFLTSPVPGIWVVNADGTGRRLVVRGVRPNVLGWSPDGRKLVFDAGSAYDQHVFVVDASGTGHWPPQVDQGLQRGSPTLVVAGRPHDRIYLHDREERRHLHGERRRHRAAPVDDGS
jgi:Tol biopolymer transport system component